MNIPRERLTIRFARAGGPGGQNVNKVETKAEVRFKVAEADWIPPPARERLRALEASRINREGELVIASDRFRTQAQNIEDCLRKLEEMLTAASRRPKRRIATRPTRASKERRRQAKRQRGERKSARRWRPGGD
jgi:ribosome-associated protein